MNIADYIDHTVLKTTTSLSDIETLCQEAIKHQFKAVCVPPYYVKNATEFLKNSSVQIATVIGFPFGYQDMEAKKIEVLKAIEQGADEVDVVANIAAIKNEDWTTISKELNILLQIVRLHEKKLKWIIESADLSDDEIIKCCEIANLHQIDFMKTSTGYGTGGASLHAVQLMKQHLLPQIEIKASGGIRDKASAMEYLQLGVTRIGTSSGINML